MFQLAGICLLCLSLVPVTVQQIDVSLLPSNPTIRKSLGNNVVITCSAEGITSQDQVEYRWFRGDGSDPLREITETDIPVSSGTYVQDLTTRKKLNFKQLQESDAGLYTCKGIINGANSLKSFTLEVIQDITFQDFNPTQRIVLHSSAKIVCIVTGSPSPTVSWSFKPIRSSTIQPIIPGDKYQQASDGLVITNVTSLNEEGTYYCMAEQTTLGEQQDRQISVEVIVPPVWVTKPKYTEGVLRQEVRMFCNATGKPAPRYTWFKGSSRDSPDFLDISTDPRIDAFEESGELVIRNIKQSDEGPYTCEALVDIGNQADPNDDVKVSGTANLRVIIPATILNLQNVTVRKGKQIDLYCAVQGDRPVDIYFHKVGNEAPYVYPTQASDPRITLEKTESADVTSLKMTIMATKESDRANYTCLANNTGGYDRRNGTIIVHYKPTFVKMKVPDVKYHWLSSQPFKRNLTCIVESEPLPGSWQWFRGDRPISANETFQIHNMGLVSNLSVTVLPSNQYWVFGDYRCNATNDYGMDSHKITLNEADFPGPPAAVDVIGQTPTSLKLSVSTPLNQGGPPVSGYLIVAGTADAGDEKSIPFNKDEEIILEYLRPDTSYNIRVMAVNERGQGSPLETVGRTLEVSVPDQVVITSPNSSPDPDKYTVSWDKPQNGGSDITSYTVKHQTVEMVDDKGAGTVPNVKPGSEGEWVEQSKLKPERRTITLTNLSPDTWYKVQVLAVNTKGASVGNAAYFKTAKAGTVNNPSEVRDNPNSGTTITITLLTIVAAMVTTLL